MSEHLLNDAGVGGDVELLLLHGWGFTAEVWDGFAHGKSRGYRVRTLDWVAEDPGRKTEEGRAKTLEALSELDKIVESVARSVPQPAFWVGWSLGATVALCLALRYPRLVRGLVMLCGTPCFVQHADWPHAVEEEVLAQFESELRQDQRTALARFVSLQTQGSASAHRDARILRRQLSHHGEQSLARLLAGLQLLRDVDLRQQLAALRLPVLLLHGQHDALVPPAVGAALVQRLPHASAHVVLGAAHVPFISHPQEVWASIDTFVSSCSADAAAGGAT